MQRKYVLTKSTLKKKDTKPLFASIPRGVGKIMKKRDLPSASARLNKES